MLVLSRRADQKIVFPSIGVTVKLLKINRGVAKVGIDAPRDLQILREEIPHTKLPSPHADASAGSTRASDRHELRNRLNAAKLGVHLARRQLHSGDTEKAADTLDFVIDGFRKADDLMYAMQTRRQSALLVDDDCNERELLAAYLKTFGFQVETVGNGSEALAYLENHALPDVVLMDMVMPVCDGATAIKSIRETPKMRELKVFGVSGTEPRDSGVSVGPAGVDGWFMNPLDPEELLGCIRSANLSASVTL